MENKGDSIIIFGTSSANIRDVFDYGLDEFISIAHNLSQHVRPLKRGRKEFKSVYHLALFKKLKLKPVAPKPKPTNFVDTLSRDGAMRYGTMALYSIGSFGSIVSLTRTVIDRPKKKTAYSPTLKAVEEGNYTSPQEVSLTRTVIERPKKKMAYSTTLTQIDPLNH
ncbi:hypothetical protein YC2023_035337 [Brassica napus]